VLLQLPNAGDDLQAIKKGVVELADLVVFNKADIDARATELAMAQMRSALAMLRPSSPNWRPPVLKVSALANEGVSEFWQAIDDYRRVLGESGELAARRRHQASAWMWQLIDAGLRRQFHDAPGVKAALPEMARLVEAGTVTPNAAAHRLMGLLKRTH
jgi:LAO/AO transport system kinase